MFGSPAMRDYPLSLPLLKDSMAEPSFMTRKKTPAETRSAPTATVSPEKAVINIAVSDIRYLPYTVSMSPNGASTGSTTAPWYHREKVNMEPEPE